MSVRFKITDLELLEKSYVDFKRYVDNKIDIEIVDGYAVVRAEPYQLFSFASLYGGNIFSKHKKLRLLESQSCNIEIPKSFTNTPIDIVTQWNQKIEFHPGFLTMAESWMIRNFVDILSADDQEKLIRGVGDINFYQSISFEEDIQYAYRIIDSTLILIREQNRISVITSLWRTEWYDV